MEEQDWIVMFALMKGTESNQLLWVVWAGFERGSCAVQVLCFGFLCPHVLSGLKWPPFRQHNDLTKVRLSPTLDISYATQVAQSQLEHRAGHEHSCHMFPSCAGSGKGCVLPHSRIDGISRVCRNKCHLVVENRNRGGHTTRWRTAMVTGCNRKMAKNKTKPNICHFLLLTCLRHRCGFLGPHSSWVFPFWDPQT